MAMRTSSADGGAAARASASTARKRARSSWESLFGPAVAPAKNCTCDLIPCLCGDVSEWVASPEPVGEDEVKVVEGDDGSTFAELVLNPDAGPSERRVTLASELSRTLKPHQQEGVRFMWRSVSKNDGCVLADHMGLGKTLQLISLLRAYFDDERAKHHLAHEEMQQQEEEEEEKLLHAGSGGGGGCDSSSWPQRRRRRHHHHDHHSAAAAAAAAAVATLPVDEPRPTTALVVAPAFVISNWMDEIRRWLPNDMALKARVLPTTGGAATRHEALTRWAEEGGTLLVGYEMFRQLVAAASAGATGSASHEEANKAARIRAALCDPGPGLLVLDEAHRLKEPRSQLYRALSSVKTPRRVLASGYPVQNRLDEYWALVSFARADALGHYEAFRAFFERPIAAHIDAAVDSGGGGDVGGATEGTTEAVAMRRAYALQAALAPVVLRRGGEELGDALPPRTDWIVRCELSATQARLYAAFEAVHVLSGGASNGELAAYHTALAIVNHPDIIHAALVDEERIFEQRHAPSPVTVMNDSHTHRGWVAPEVAAKQSREVEAQRLRDEARRAKQQRKVSAQCARRQLDDDSSPDGDDELAAYLEAAAEGAELSSWAKPVLRPLIDRDAASKMNNAHAHDDDDDDAATDVAGYAVGEVQGRFGSGKTAVAIAIMQTAVARGESVIVFTQTLGTLDVLARMMTAKGIRFRRIDGATAPPVRASIVDTFNATSRDLHVERENAARAAASSSSNKSATSSSHTTTTTKPPPLSSASQKALSYHQATAAAKKKRKFAPSAAAGNHTKNNKAAGRVAAGGASKGGTRSGSRRRGDPTQGAAGDAPCDVLLMSIKAGGEGINLTGASRVILFDVCWNPCFDQQAMCRAHRFGQKRPVHVYRLVGPRGTMEERVLRQQRRKELLVREVIEQDGETLRRHIATCVYSRHHALAANTTNDDGDDDTGHPQHDHDHDDDDDDEAASSGPKKQHLIGDAVLDAVLRKVPDAISSVHECAFVEPTAGSAGGANAETTAVDDGTHLDRLDAFAAKPRYELSEDDKSLALAEYDDFCTSLGLTKRTTLLSSKIAKTNDNNGPAGGLPLERHAS